MKVIRHSSLEGSDREVQCPQGGFTSFRPVLAADGLGFSMHRTEIPQGAPQRWHYKHHQEACHCIAGKGILRSEATGDEWTIVPGDTYVLDENDPHTFQALTDVTLISVFNPPVTGREVHDDNGSYPAPERPTRSPVYDVRPVPIDKIQANDYNPNAVAPPEMELLRVSIEADGYTQPVVTFYDQESDRYIVVDGFHRFLILKQNAEIRERENGCLPCVVIDKNLSDRMASTIRHNRARGSHNIELMSAIVAELVEMGKGDRWICSHIGMSADELLRMKQITGIAALFENSDFSDSWEAELSAAEEDEQFEEVG